MLTTTPLTSSTKLTALQSGMLYHAVSASKPGVDTEHVIMELSEPLDIERFRQAWQIVIEATPVLRTRFDWKSSSQPRRVVDQRNELDITTLDLSSLSETETDQVLLELQESDRSKPFDLESTPMRLRIVHLGPERWWVLWSFHHILLDGRSFPLVLRALFGAYDHGSTPAARPSFDQFVEAQATVGADQATAWHRRLSSQDPQPSLSVEPFAGLRLSSAFGAVERSLSASATRQLRAEAETQGCSLNNLVQSAWAILLHRYLGTPTVTFGTTRACRHITPEAQDTIGLLINTVPFAVHIDRASALSTLTAAVREEHAELRELEATPLTEIKRAAGLDAGAELFESLLMFDEASLGHRLQDLGQHRSFRYVGQTNFPLAALVYGDNELLVRLEFDRDRFSDEAASRIADQLCIILRSLIGAGSSPVGSLRYLTPHDHELLASHNNTAVEWNGERDLVGMFEAQVRRTPHADALTHNGSCLSYAEFNASANKLARELRKRGVGSESIVGLYARRSFEELIAIYAIVKAGGAYLPLDPEYPSDRLRFMIEDANCDIVLTAGGTEKDSERLGTTTIDLTSGRDAWADQPDTNLGVEISESDAAYVLFTSGSTGRPKGVVNEHRGIVNRLRWMQQALALTADDVVLHKTPFTFDVSVWELFWPLQIGASLAIAAPESHRDPQALVREIETAGVTTMHFVPSMLTLFVEEPSITRCGSLATIICSGEALTRDLQDRTLSKLDVDLHNLYGPTEAAIDVTWWPCDPNSDLPVVPIGSAIANTSMHVVDQDLQLTPPGAQGELLIGGTQVARGYLRRPDLNTERFIDSCAPETDVTDRYPQGRVYRTGDLGRYRADGSIEYLGRTDHQVKIRGLRIELGEIEATLAGCEGISNCVVIDREDRPGHKQLAAYVVATDGAADRARLEGSIRETLSSSLADYMVPSSFTFLDKLPLSTAGKVDRSSLPKPLSPEVADIQAPAGAVEQRVAAIWADLLEHPDIDRSTPFFQAGGHSLMVIALAQRLSTAFGQEVGVTDLIDRSTVASQAEFLSTDTVSADQARLAEAVANRKRGSAKRRRGRRPSPPR